MELSGNNSFGLLLLTSPSALSLKYPCQNVLTHNKYVQFYTRHFTAIDVLVSHLCIFKWFMYLYFLKLVFSFFLLYLTHIEWQCHTDYACTIPHHISHLCIWIVLLYARLKNGRIMLWQCLSVLPSVCPSVRPSFPDFFSTCFEISIWNLVYAFSRWHDMSSLSFITIGSLWPSLQPNVGQTQFLQL